jgi:hypothetical protein
MAEMIALSCFVLAVPASPFKSKSRLEAENAALQYGRSFCVARCPVTVANQTFLVMLEGCLRTAAPSVLGDDDWASTKGKGRP